MARNCPLSNNNYSPFLKTVKPLANNIVSDTLLWRNQRPTHHAKIAWTEFQNNASSVVGVSHQQLVLSLSWCLSTITTLILWVWPCPGEWTSTFSTKPSLQLAWSCCGPSTAQLTYGLNTSKNAYGTQCSWSVQKVIKEPMEFIEDGNDQLQKCWFQYFQLSLFAVFPLS